MTKERSSAWKTILQGFFLGLIVTLLSTYGSFVVGLSGSPLLILAALSIAAIAVAILIPKHRTFSISMIAGGLTGVLASWVAVVALFSDGLFSTNTREDMTATQLEQWIGLDFPASASNIRSHAEGFQDWQVRVRFEMPKAEVEPFLKTNNLEPEREIITSFFNEDLERDWWTPNTNTPPNMFTLKLKTGTSIQTQTKTGFYPTIQLVDLPDGNVTVYIMAFNT
jgi:hypothetical protein